MNQIVDLLEFAGVANGDVSSEAVGELDATQLLLDGLTQVNLVDVALHEQRLGELPERPQRPVELLLLRIAADRTPGAAAADRALAERSVPSC